MSSSLPTEISILRENFWLPQPTVRPQGSGSSRSQFLRDSCGNNFKSSEWRWGRRLTAVCPAAQPGSIVRSLPPKAACSAPRSSAPSPRMSMKHFLSQLPPFEPLRQEMIRLSIRTWGEPPPEYNNHLLWGFFTRSSLPLFFDFFTIKTLWYVFSRIIEIVYHCSAAGLWLPMMELLKFKTRRLFFMSWWIYQRKKRMKYSFRSSRNIKYWSSG